MTIFAFACPENATRNLVWAFDDPEQYLGAVQIAHAWNAPIIQYHGVARGADGEVTRTDATAWKNISDERWIELSEGVNDSEEFSEWCKATFGPGVV